jgi:hypothetical protein
MVVLDWFSRRILARRLSITMEASFCSIEGIGQMGRCQALTTFAPGSNLIPSNMGVLQCPVQFRMLPLVKGCR